MAELSPSRRRRSSNSPAESEVRIESSSTPVTVGNARTASPAETCDAKAANKTGLRKRLGLLADDDTPILGMVSRMTHQKGCDLVIAAAEPLLEQGAQFAVLGSGESLMEEAWRKLAGRHPGAVGVQIGFDDRLGGGSTFWIELPRRVS